MSKVEKTVQDARDHIERLVEKLSPKEYLEFLEQLIDWLSAFEDCAIEESEE